MGMTAASWTRYPKMEQSSSCSGHYGGDWIVTEKLHGANFSIVADRQYGVCFAKRSGILANDEDFFSFRSQGLGEQLAVAACRLLDEAAGAASVTVFGELCGGAYPHPEQPAVDGLAPVQRGVWYSPSLCFVVFDVRVLHNGDCSRFLDFDQARQLSEAAGFLFSAPLARGSLSVCLDFPVEYQSRLAARLGLPPLSGDNLAEGVVVRSAVEAGGQKPGQRAMFKRKIAAFSEKQYSNPAWRAAAAGGASGRAEGRELLRYELLACVSEPRLAAVESKLGRVDATDRAACRRLLEDYKTDVREALEADGLLGSGAPPLDQGLEAELDTAARALIRRHLLHG